MKTNRELNMEHVAREEQRVRPKQPDYDFKPLEDIVNSWVRETVAKKQQEQKG